MLHRVRLLHAVLDGVVKKTGRACWPSWVDVQFVGDDEEDGDSPLPTL